MVTLILLISIDCIVYTDQFFKLKDSNLMIWDYIHSVDSVLNITSKIFFQWIKFEPNKEFKILLKMAISGDVLKYIFM